MECVAIKSDLQCNITCRCEGNENENLK